MQDLNTKIWRNIGTTIQSVTLITILESGIFIPFTMTGQGNGLAGCLFSVTLRG